MQHRLKIVAHEIQDFYANVGRMKSCAIAISASAPARFSETATGPAAFLARAFKFQRLEIPSLRHRYAVSLDERRATRRRL
jgi:hypothetical protein